MNLCEEDSSLISVKYAGKPFKAMDDMELVATVQGLLVRIKVVTGWSIPDLENERRILYAELAIHLQEKWSTLNHEEIMYSVRNYAGTDWGKNVNLKLLDEALDTYYKKRLELSKFEEHKAAKAREDVKKLTLPADWKEVIEMDYQHFLKGQLNIHLMPHQVYDECVLVGYIEEDAYEDWLSEAREKLIASETGEREMALLARNSKEAAEHAARIDEFKQGNDMVKFYSKRLCVQHLFSVAQKKGIKNLFIKEIPV